MSAATPRRAVNILLVEDNPDDIFLTRRAMEDGALQKALFVVENGEDALRFLYREPPFEEAPRPKLVLLDLLLPGISGLEVLRRMNRDAALRPIPVIILTSSDDPADLLAAYDERARAFITKPGTQPEFEKMIAGVEAFWLQTAQLPLE